jgi:hypothetical protein
LGLDQRLAVSARRARPNSAGRGECEAVFGGAPGLKPIPPRPDAPTYHESILLLRGIPIHYQEHRCPDVYLFDAIFTLVATLFVCTALDFLKRENQIFAREDDPRLVSYEINFTQSRKYN